jgi:hypothetical protein
MVQEMLSVSDKTSRSRCRISLINQFQPFAYKEIGLILGVEHNANINFLKNRAMLFYKQTH